LTDSKSNTWTLIRTDDFFGTAVLKSYYVSAPTVGSGHTFTPATNNGAISVAAFSGVATSSPLDQSNGANDSDGGSTVTSGSITPTVDSCLVVAILYFESGTVTGTPSGFTSLSSAVGGSGTAIAYLVQGSAAAVNSTWTLSTGNTRLNAHIMSFKPGAGGGSAGGPLIAGGSLRHGALIRGGRLAA
jgi:hypothetical protein